jgi:hypothetical protein
MKEKGGKVRAKSEHADFFISRNDFHLPCDIRFSLLSFLFSLSSDFSFFRNCMSENG